MTDQVASIIKAAVKAAFKIEIEPEVTEADPRFGDFATNVAFLLASQLKLPPQEIASQLAAAIKDPLVESATAAGGFVNLNLTHDAWVGLLQGIDGDYGCSQTGEGKRVQVEFVSANPTGPLTLGNARGGFIGDTLARALKHSGYQVWREYYLNDAGNQIEQLKNSIFARASESLMSLGHEVEAAYKGTYVNELGSEVAAELQRRHPEAQDWSLQECKKAVYELLEERDVLGEITGWIKDSVGALGIEFDGWFSEARELHGTGKVEAMLAHLKQAKLTEEHEGAVWLKTEGCERDRVLMKTDGTATYLLVDLAYHWNKFVERGFDEVVDVWGADHAGQVPAMLEAANKLFPGKQLRFIILQFVRLIQDGKEVKMSKRAGTYVTTDELISEVGADVARFFFLMRSADTHMDFDLGLAKEESQKNPYWYVMYSYARAKSILREADKAGLKPTATMGTLSDKERELAKQMSRLPEVVAEVATDHTVHKLTHYGLATAKLFHDWYESERIIKLPKDEAGAKLFFVARYITFMEVYCGLVGIKPLAKM